MVRKNEVSRNGLLELDFLAANSTTPRPDATIDLIVTDPQGIGTKHPGFWAGGNVWRARVTSPLLGTHRYLSEASDTTDAGLHGQSGEFCVVPYIGTNPLFLHGKVTVTSDRRHFAHADGSPFFWLGDTWWMGLTKRLHWPEEFAILTQDRVRKGFTVAQVVVGLYPDMLPFDARGANEAGFPWDGPGFNQINPAYFDLMDRRVEHLVEAGLVPCIVGFWGYFLNLMDVTGMERHWRYLIARYGTYPVIWCMAGEAMMPYPLDPKVPWYSAHRLNKQKRAIWSGLARYIKELDGYRNPLLTRSPLEKLAPHPEWVGADLTFGGGVPGQFRIIYRFLPGTFWILKLEKGIHYSAKWVDPETGQETPLGIITPTGDGRWKTPRPPVRKDWLIVLERV